MVLKKVNPLDWDLGNVPPGIAWGGVDEAGRGAWAGPVVAACAVLDPESVNRWGHVLRTAKDSKKLNPEKRESIAAELKMVLRAWAVAADTRKVFAAAQAGATWARDIIGAAANALAIGLVDLQRLLDPEVVVLGGGIGLLPAFQASLDDALADIQPRLRPRIASARLGADAGIIGIADYASFER